MPQTTTTISFVTDPASIADAVAVARLVTPRSGLLFTARADRCNVTSHDGAREARSSFSITESVGEGDFVYPTDFADEFAYLTGPIRFDAKSDGRTFSVGYTFGAGGLVTHASIDPRCVPSAKHPEAALASQVNVGVLAAALKVAKPFLAAADDVLAEDHSKTLHVFRDGTLYASDGRVACYFRSDALVGRELEIPAQQLPLLEKFLRRSTGMLDIQTTSARITMVNERGDALGWPRNTGRLTRCASLTKNDDVIAVVSAAAARATIRHLQSALDKHARNVRVHLDPARGCWFTCATATSLPIAGDFLEFRPSGALVGRVNIDRFAKLFTATSSDAIELRVTLAPPGGSRVEPAFFFRTVDNLVITADSAILVGDAAARAAANAHRCSVTRYAPGIDR